MGMEGEGPWLHRLWRFDAIALAPTLAGAGVLLAKDHGALGGYRGAGTDLCVNALFLTGPALFVGALALTGVGLVGLARVGPYRGYGVATLAGIALVTVAVLSTLLAVGIAASR
jgi:hypothetical protein